MNKGKVMGMSKALRIKEAGLKWRLFQCLPILKGQPRKTLRAHGSLRWEIDYWAPLKNEL